MFCFRNSLLTPALRKNCSPLLYSNNIPHLLKPSVVISKCFHRQVNEGVEAKLRAEDKIPDSYKIIYRAPLKNYLKITYYAAFTSLAVMIPVISSSIYMSKLQNYPITFYNTEVIHSIDELCGLVGGLLFVILQVGMVVFKYPLRIYRNKEKKHYIAVYQHVLPWKYHNEQFMAGELKKSTSRMPWKDCLYVFRKKKAILLEDYFSKPVDLNEMLQPSHVPTAKLNKNS